MGVIRVVEELKEMIVRNSTDTSPVPKIIIQALLPSKFITKCVLKKTKPLLLHKKEHATKTACP